MRKGGLVASMLAMIGLNSVMGRSAAPGLGSGHQPGERAMKSRGAGPKGAPGSNTGFKFCPLGMSRMRNPLRFESRRDGTKMLYR